MLARFGLESPAAPEADGRILRHHHTRGSVPSATAALSRAGTLAAFGVMSMALPGNLARKRYRFRRNQVPLHALKFDVLQSSKEELSDAVVEIAGLVATAKADKAQPLFCLLAVPPQWGPEIAAASKQLRDTGTLPNGAPLLGFQETGAKMLRMVLAFGDAEDTAQAFFVNKEELSQAGKGLAKENPVPGVPDGSHGSMLLFADPKLPALLTRNLTESLDARYSKATKAGLVVMPVKPPKDSDTKNADDDWEPPRKGRQLWTRNRSDGHGWMKGDPTFDAAAQSTPDLKMEFKKRPFGINRYSPGLRGKGAMIVDMQTKSRYPGDPLGQAVTNGIKTGMVITSINGTDVREWDFEDLMDLVNDVGIMDPDSKSAAGWGEGGEAERKRKPVEEAELPVEMEFATAETKGPALAPLCLDGAPKRDGVLGLALSTSAGAALSLAGCKKLGPKLQVTKAGHNPEGGFAVHSILVKDKEMPAAVALKGYAKASGLKSMKGMCVGVERPAAETRIDAESLAAEWAVFPMIGVTQEGGLVMRCKGLAAEGLGTDDSLKSLQFFSPVDSTDEVAGLAGLATRDAGASAGASLAFVTDPQVLESSPELGIAGGAVIGAAGVHNFGKEGPPTFVHRQATSIVGFA